jgi:hypothetical protein
MLSAKYITFYGASYIGTYMLTNNPINASVALMTSIGLTVILNLWIK